MHTYVYVSRVIVRYLILYIIAAECLPSAVTGIGFHTTQFSIAMFWAPVISIADRVCIDRYEIKYSYGFHSSEVQTYATEFELTGLIPGTLVHFAVRALSTCAVHEAGEWTFAMQSTGQGPS